MNPDTVKKYIKQHSIPAKFSEHPKVNALTTDGAIIATGSKAEGIVKVLLFVDKQQNMALTIIQGNKKVDGKKIPNLKRPDLASPEQVKTFLNGEIGGIAPIALPNNITKYVDEGVMEQEFIYGSGGSRFTSIKIQPKFILEQDNCIVVNLAKE